MGAEDVTIRTIGHGTLDGARFAELVRDAGVAEVVDVRSYPGSRHNPQYGADELARWLPEEGLGYRWLADLGGRRRPVEGSQHVALRHPSFRAYADHMERPSFLAGIDQLLAAEGPSVVMCSESVWWRCHRRLIADHLVLVRGIQVLHVMHDGRVLPHGPTDGVRVEGDELVYDVGATPSLPDL